MGGSSGGSGETVDSWRELEETGGVGRGGVRDGTGGVVRCGCCTGDVGPPTAVVDWEAARREFRNSIILSGQLVLDTGSHVASDSG